MLSQNGSKQQNIKENNRALVLQAVLNKNVISRAEIARQLELTKTTLTNIVGELIEDQILIEADAAVGGSSNAIGRKSISLDLSPKAPLICGVLVQRGNFHIVASNLKGELVADSKYSYVGLISPAEFEERLTELFYHCCKQLHQDLLAVGISCLGPLNTVTGRMLNPHKFFSEDCDFDIVDFFARLTSLPTYLYNDATAGAVAEKLFGTARDDENFIYISTFNGIGAGLYLDNKLYNGEIGQNGELGHMSINFSGPRCVCGNSGCLELYTDVQKIIREFSNFKEFLPNHALFSKESNTILDVLLLIDNNDVLAMSIMTEYCKYLSFAVSNLMTQLNINKVILAGSTKTTSHFFEYTLMHMINERSFLAKRQKNLVVKSCFGLDSPLYGSVGIVLEKIFSGDIYPVAP